MRGDFSRLRFDAAAKYKRVMQQQGRVLLDSDWNASVALISDQLRDLRDLILPSDAAAGPRGNAGFEISGTYFASLNQGDEDLPTGIAVAATDDLPFGHVERVRIVDLEEWYSEISETFEVVIGDETLRVHLERESLEIVVTERDVEVDVMARPYTMSMDLRRMQGATGTLLDYRGSFGLLVGEEGRLVYYDQQGNTQTTASGLVPEDRVFSLTVTTSLDAFVVYIDGQDVLRRALPPVSEVAPDEPPLIVGAACAVASDVVQDPLACDLERWRLWTVPIPGSVLHGLDAKSLARLSDFLVSDLDFSNDLDDRIHDRSGHGHFGFVFCLDEPDVWFGVGDLWIGQGRYILGGTEISNDAPVRFSRQPFCQNAIRRDALGGANFGALVLEAWPNFVTAIEDPKIAEPALGGAQTTGRVEDIWQVKLLVSETADNAAGQMDLLRAQQKDQGRLAMRRRDTAAMSVGNQLYRVEIAQGGCADTADPWRASVDMQEYSVRTTRVGDDLIAVTSGPVGAELVAGTTAAILVNTDAGTVKRVVEVKEILPSETAGQQICRIALGDYPSLEQMLRDHVQGAIETRGQPKADADDLDFDCLRIVPLARYRYSDANASVAFAVAGIEVDEGADSQPLGRVNLAGLREGLGAIAPGDWVELGSRSLSVDRRAGPMYEVGNVDLGLLQVDLKGWTPTLTTLSVHHNNDLILRKWSVRPSDWHEMSAKRHSAAGPVYSVMSDGWSELERGIELRFSGDGWYGRGAYWTAPSRENGLRSLEWPGPPDRPTLVPPEGPRISHAKIALIERNDDEIEIRDCRQLIEPLARFPAQEPPIDEDPEEPDDGGDEPVTDPVDEDDRGRVIEVTEDDGRVTITVDDDEIDITVTENPDPPRRRRGPFYFLCRWLSALFCWRGDRGHDRRPERDLDETSALWLKTAFHGGARLLLTSDAASHEQTRRLGLVPEGSIFVEREGQLEWREIFPNVEGDVGKLFTPGCRIVRDENGQGFWVIAFEKPQYEFADGAGAMDVEMCSCHIWYVTAQEDGKPHARLIKQNLQAVPDELVAVSRAQRLILVGAESGEGGFQAGYVHALDLAGGVEVMHEVSIEHQGTSLNSIGGVSYLTGGKYDQSRKAFWTEDMSGENRREIYPAFQPEYRYAAATAVHDGHLYRFGGFDEDLRTYRQDADVFDPALPGWGAIRDMPRMVGRIFATASPFGPIIVDQRGQVVLYDTDTHKFRRLGTVPLGEITSVTVLGRRCPVLYVLGYGGEVWVAAHLSERLTVMHWESRE